MDFNGITDGLKKGFDVWKENAVAYIIGCIIVGLSFFVAVAGLGFSIFSTFVISLILSIVAMSTGSTAAAIGSIAVSAIIALVFRLLVILFLILVSVPLGFGLINMAIKGARGDKVEIKDIFYSFTSLKVYKRNVTFAFAIFIPFIVLAIISIIIPLIPIVGFVLMLFIPIAFIIIVILLPFLLIFSAHIYIMKPSENVMYAISENLNIVKANFVMVFVLILICGLVGSIPFVSPVSLIAVTFILKELKPDLRDESV